MAKIAIDLDGTITGLPAFFSFLTKALMAQGHEVHIITYRFPHLRVETAALLERLGVPFTGLHLPDTMTPEPAPSWKAKKAVEIGIDMLFEDDINNLMAMPPNVVRVWVGQQLQEKK